MLDILEDSTEDEIPTHQSLELDRIKEKIRIVWNKILCANYSEEYADVNEDSEHYISESKFLEDNALFFPGEERPENEVEKLIYMLDELFDPQEDLTPVASKGKAPSYKGSALKTNKEKGTSLNETFYEMKHTTSKAPKDSQFKAKSSGYKHPSSEAISKRKDGKSTVIEIKEVISPFIEKIKEDLRSLEEMQQIGRRRQLFR